MKYKPSEALNLMQDTIKADCSPFLIGGTGVGKSAIVEDVRDILAGKRKIVRKVNPSAKEFGWIDFRASLFESHDLSGIPYIENGEQKRAYLPNLPVSGEGMLFLDEFGQAHHSMQTVLSQLLYERRIGEYELPTPENGKGNWIIACASNRAIDRAGSNKIPSHLYSRVTMIDFVHDSNDWFDWAVKNDVHPDVLGFLTFQPNWLNVFDPKVIAPQPCPRSWTRLSDILNTNPVSSFQSLADCNVGETASIEFASFLQLKEDVPDLQKICEGKIDTPPKAKEKKKQNGIYFASVVALITVIKEASESLVESYFENALRYIEQYPTPEYEIFFVRSVVNARNELVETTTFNEFKVKHQDLKV
jgi:hypothetical protein|tara:strand:+ start:1222 stop:2304 length:1083 start_codon:yes stop_codon:yes gene_type:complete